jgi:hypothetical protein
MPRYYKEMIDEIINKMDEDAPTNSVAGGGVDMNPNGKKKKDDAEDVLRRTIMKKLGNRIKESDDMNNVVFRGVLKTLDKLDDKVDELSGIVKEEITVEAEEDKKSIREKAKV